MTIIIIADVFKRGQKSVGNIGLTEHSKKHNLFEQQYSTIRSVFPKSKIVYIYGFDGKRFRSYINNFSFENTTFIYNGLYNRYNHGYSLSLGLTEVCFDEECLILFGYQPIKKPLLKKIKNTKASKAIISMSIESDLGCVFGGDNNINHIFLDLDNYIQNIYLLKPEETNILKKTYKAELGRLDNMFLFEVINRIIEHNGIFEPLII